MKNTVLRQKYSKEAVKKGTVGIISKFNNISINKSLENKQHEKKIRQYIKLL